MDRAGLIHVAVGIVLLGAGSVFSDGYRNPPATAEGNAKASAHRVFCDDASALFYNPANLARLERPSYLFGLTMARQKHEVTGANGRVARSEGDWVLLPNLFFAAPVKDTGWSWGVSVTSPHGQGGNYDADELLAATGFTNAVVYDAEMMLVSVGPTVAYALSDQWSVGVGANIYYSRLELQQVVPLGPFTSQRFEAESDGMGFGGNVGVSWEPVEHHHIAFTYTSQFKIEYEGDLSVRDAGLVSASSDYSSPITFPDIFGIGYGIELGERVRLEANVEWLRWSLNRSFVMDAPPNPSTVVPQDWNDTWTFALGGELQLVEGLMLSAGYAFIETPIPDETITPILPDMDRHVFSMGLGWRAGYHGVDLSYSHSLYKERDTTGNPANIYRADFKTKSNLVGLTYSYLF
jgi:long-chain fatty acid transport protein